MEIEKQHPQETDHQQILCIYALLEVNIWPCGPVSKLLDLCFLMLWQLRTLQYIIVWKPEEPAL